MWGLKWRFKCGFSGEALMVERDFLIMTFSSWLFHHVDFWDWNCLFLKDQGTFLWSWWGFLSWGLFEDCNAIFWFRCYFLWLRSRCCFLGCFLMISTQTFDHAFFEVLLLIIKTKIYFYYYDKLLWYGFWFFASYFLKIGHSLFNFR